MSERFSAPRAGLLLAVVALGIGAGALFIGPVLEGERAAFVLLELRLPRVLAGALVGATLSLVGAVFQGLFHNALASESTIGTTAGATLGALVALSFNVAGRLEGLPIVVLAAFSGALLASLIVAAAAQSLRARTDDVLLAGIAVTLASSAISSGLQYSSDAPKLFAAAQWSLGHLPQVGYGGVLVLLPFVVPCAGLLLLLTRGLQAIAIGEETAHSQGVDVRRLRTFALALGSLGVAACVAWCGPIAFVGLVVPHLIRGLVGPLLRNVLPLSLIGGAGFLMGCDALARLVLPGQELPVGVVTAALGAPALVLILIQRRA